MTSLQLSSPAHAKPAPARRTRAAPAGGDQQPVSGRTAIAERSERQLVPGFWNPLAQAYQSEEQLWAWWGSWDL
jgi:hypothetical protein